METEGLTDNIIERFKIWLRYFVIGIWSLILFGIAGFSILAYIAIKHVETLESQTASSNINKENIHARYKN